MKNIRVVIITGLSGSGKSTALRALEDIGFFCVDNLPVLLLPKFLDIQADVSGEISKVALVMDLREKSFLEKFVQTILKLQRKKYNIEILFLDASEEALLRRFSETRRSHPLSEKRTVLESIKVEREQLAQIKEMAHNIIDTSFFNVHELKEIVQTHYLHPLEGKKLIINITSFGYRYGLPPDADIVFDVRFLPNPYFVKDLQNYNGNDQSVDQFVFKWDETKQFLSELLNMMSFLIPLFEKEGKAYLTISIGCTGGKHRSVVIANHLADFFLEKKYTVNLNHRDIRRS
ncbi:MAG: RNase adapter RapZ [Syntrophales bacterium]|jgi:UPF0042 nucleotide-binding protein|nr:RNase adapter RapZ [Syntrophales bacterium]MDY0043283.1 RNase adapter RapZ [Syntrophales bacterium]